MAGPGLIEQGVTRRRAIMRFVKAYIKKNGFAPSIEEITEGVGLLSKTATRNHLAILKDTGHVTWTDGKYRSLRVL